MEKAGDIPSIAQSMAYSTAYEHLNDGLFDGKLSQPMLVLNRNSNIVGGYFGAERWHNDDGTVVHEISLNANNMRDDVFMLMGILVHEMVHLWQHEFGKPGRGGYHNQEFADKCKSIGLTPKAVDGSGKEVGEALTTTVDSNSLAERVISEIPEEAILPWMSVADPSPDPGGGNGGGKKGEPEKPAPRSGKRAKYTCPICGLNAWARASVSLVCGDCDRLLIEQREG